MQTRWRPSRRGPAITPDELLRRLDEIQKRGTDTLLGAVLGKTPWTDSDLFPRSVDSWKQDFLSLLTAIGVAGETAERLEDLPNDKEAVRAGLETVKELRAVARAPRKPRSTGLEIAAAYTVAMARALDQAREHHSAALRQMALDDEPTAAEWDQARARFAPIREFAVTWQQYRETGRVEWHLLIIQPKSTPNDGQQFGDEAHRAGRMLERMISIPIPGKFPVENPSGDLRDRWLNAVVAVIPEIQAQSGYGNNDVGLHDDGQIKSIIKASALVCGHLASHARR